MTPRQIAEFLTFHLDLRGPHVPVTFRLALEPRFKRTAVGQRRPFLADEPDSLRHTADSPLGTVRARTADYDVVAFDAQELLNFIAQDQRAYDRSQSGFTSYQQQESYVE